MREESHNMKVGLKVTWKKTKVKFNNQLTGQQIMITDEILDSKEINVSRTNNGRKSFTQKRMRFRLEKESNLALSVNRKVYSQFILPIPHVQLSYLASYK